MNIPSGFPSRHLTPPAEQAFAPRTIGSGLEACRRELAICGRDLRSAMPARGVIFIDEALKLLARLTCRIAVVGQVKSGKSSFINALVKRPSLLPTDVNPWTTAITQLHFGRSDAPPNTAAEFTFFDANEWEHLAKGNGYIRELTQRLVPGFEEDLLRSHVNAMRRRSEERLGPELGRLLGQKHTFPEVSSGVLERYVCSGPLDNTARTGFYSDIVKGADLYFEGVSEFGFPTTIVDTPGTNDPFLVRDEITRRALSTADIYVVVLTARQALSSADLALIRILRGLNKERIVVFINRIDELGDPTRDVETVVKHVRAGLKQEFPSSTIPIVAGSAYWANTAQVGREDEVGRAYSDNLKAYAAHLKAVGGRVSLSDRSDRGEILTQCSGLPLLTQELAKLAIHSHAGYVLKQIARSFTEFVDVGQSAAQHELELLARGGAPARSSSLASAGAVPAAGATTSADNERVATLLKGVLDNLQARSSQVIEKHYIQIRDRLRDAVQAFADDECENLRQAIAAGHRYQAWRCETTALRRELERCFVDQFRAAQREMGGLDSQLIPALQALLRRHYPQWKQASEPEQGPSASMPSLHALSQTVSLDLGEPWWRRWWGMIRKDEDRIADIERLIKAEFYPLVEEMSETARSHLRAVQDAAMHSATAIYLGLVEGMEEQRTAHDARQPAPATLGSVESVNPRITELRKQLALMQLVAQRLRDIDRKWAQGIN